MIKSARTATRAKGFEPVPHIPFVSVNQKTNDERKPEGN
jgi:hypothetical protein